MLGTDGHPGGGEDTPALRARLVEALRPLAAGRAAWGLLDFPDHWNIGDSAIWAGEAGLLGALHGCPPAYVSHLRYPVAEIARLMPADGVIWLHGGGNFGDIWPAFQDYREAVLAQARGRRVVQLPQTLHFTRPEAVERMKRLIGAHGDVHLMVRDRESAAFARREFDCAVILAPDAAFGLDMGRVPRHPAPRGVLALLRTDKEQRPDAAAAAALFGGEGWRIADWVQPGRLRRDGERALRRALEYLPLRAAMPWRARVFTALAAARTARGFAQLDAAAVVVTDRLHGHIMARLLGKPHVVIDNSYGKIARFIAAFGGGGALQARDYAEARDMAAALLAQVQEGAPQ